MAGTLQPCNDSASKLPNDRETRQIFPASRGTLRDPRKSRFPIAASRALRKPSANLQISMSKETQTQAGTPPKKLADVLTEKSHALDVRETVQDAGDKMRSLEADSLPVLEERRLVGRIAGPHPDRSAAGHGHDPLVESVGACMSRELIFCYEDQDRSAAEKLMNEKGVLYLPIVDHDMRIVGIVTRQDLTAKAAVSQDQPGADASLK